MNEVSLSVRNNDLQNEKPEINEQELFNVLSHTTRRMILRELNKQLYLGYSELQILIPQSPGVIYHHIEKLQELRLIQQRESKEYELTPLGNQAVSYLKKLEDDDVQSLVTSQSPYQNFFLKISLSKIILKNPPRWAIEISTLMVLLFIVQVNFPVLIIGPFLMPSVLPLHSRVFIEVISFFLMFLLILLLNISFSKTTKNSLPLLAGLLLLPFLSLGASLLLYLMMLLFITVPSFFFWIVTIILQFCYVYVLIHQLIKISRLSFDKSVIITLLIGYIFLICVFIFG